jgi:hypothetical protein
VLGAFKPDTPPGLAAVEALVDAALASVDRQLLEAAGAAALELAGKILVRWS